MDHMNHTHAHLSIRGHWIDGTVVDGSLPATDIRNPATGEVVAGVPTGNADDVDRAVAAARAALPAWAATPPRARADILRRLSAILSARTAEIAEAVTAEMGAPVTLARAGHVEFPAAVAASTAELVDAVDWTEQIGNATVERRLVGVVGAITPWNFPLQQVMTKVAPALLAGNTIVLKPSEIAPLTARFLAEALRRGRSAERRLQRRLRHRTGRGRSPRGASRRRHDLLHRLHRRGAGGSWPWPRPP